MVALRRELPKEAVTVVRVVPPGDVTAFAGAVADLLDDPARCLELGQAGVDYVRRKATREAAVTAYLELLGLPAPDRSDGRAEDHPRLPS